MSIEEISSTRPTPRNPGRLHTLIAAHMLRRLRWGRLTLTTPGEHLEFSGTEPGPSADITLIRPWSALRRVIMRGSIGFAEGYLAQDWDSENLAQLVHLLALNETDEQDETLGLLPGRLLDRLRHRRKRNTLLGSRRNISYHYDLGNAFYELWLDPTMTYSSALFASPEERLEEAQNRKYDRLLDSLDATPGEHLLEIGCGWGGFAERAARRGFKVTGITLSREQLDYARKRIKDAGLSDRVSLRLQDYRNITQTYDHAVSIEMFEAVGEQYWPSFFTMLHKHIKPGGRAALQVITIDQSIFETYRENADFIQLYIFPGGMLPSISAFTDHAECAGLALRGRSLHAADYAETLKRWARNYQRASDQIKAQGFDARFLRMWSYYLAYCEAGFRTGRLNLMQTVLQNG